MTAAARGTHRCPLHERVADGAAAEALGSRQEMLTRGKRAAEHTRPGDPAGERGDPAAAARALAPAAALVAGAPVAARAAVSPGDMLGLQRAAGNAAVARALSGQVLARRTTKPEPAAPAKAPRLRTALNSKLRVTKEGDKYVAHLELDSDTECVSLPVLEYQGKASTALRDLPIFIEDVVSGGEAVVSARYNADAVDVTPLVRQTEAAGIQVRVDARSADPEELSVKAAPGARKHGKGAIVSGPEKVTKHLGGSEIDTVIASIASAEGGFATVEGTDKGVITWGQGQWTAHSGKLQKVLAFIKERRADLWDRYWGANGLDLTSGSKPQFVYGGKTWPTNTKKMMELFRPSQEQIVFWAQIFAQAGMDAQIQRLQREHMRNEAQALLDKPIGGRAPDDVLDTRGKAFLYSMDKNAPKFAKEFFRAALAKVQLPADAGAITDEHRKKVSAELEAAFKDSAVVAWDKPSHHIIAFWGERGRKRAIELCDEKIAAGGDSTWTVDQWKRHRKRMEDRQSRYQKTKRDIDAAINRKEIEPDVPADLVTDEAAGASGGGGATFLGIPLPFPAASSAAAPARLGGGAPAPSGGGGTPATFFGMPLPFPSAAANGAAPSAPAAAPAPSSAAPSPAAPAAAPAVPAPAAAPAGAPRSTALRDPGLAALVGSLRNSQVNDVAAELAALEAKAAGLKKSSGEEIGKGRDELVADVGKLRARIDQLDGAGLDERAAKDLKARFYRAINDVSPAYFQSRNIDLLEGPGRKTRTCNITSTAMALEALGKGPDKYRGDRAKLAAVAAKYHGHVAAAEHETGAALNDLRLPDFLELAAIAERLTGKQADDAAIQAAMEAAWKDIKSVFFLATLARRFGAKAEPKPFTFDPSKKRKEQSKDAYALRGIGDKHRTATETRVDARNELEAATGKGREKAAAKYKNAAALPGEDAEAKVPLEAYKQAVADQIGAELDRGDQVVVGLSGHYVRLQSLHPDHVVVDDPANPGRLNRKVTWEEARAMAYFWYRVTISA